LKSLLELNIFMGSFLLICDSHKSEKDLLTIRHRDSTKTKMKAGFIFIFVNHKEWPYCLMMNSIVDKKGLHCFGGRLAYPVIRNWHMSCEFFWYLAYLCNTVLCLLKEYLHSQGYKLIFHDLSIAWCHRLTSDTCSVNSRPRLGIY